MWWGIMPRIVSSDAAIITLREAVGKSVWQPLSKIRLCIDS